MISVLHVDFFSIWRELNRGHRTSSVCMLVITMGLQRASILNRDVTWARKANYSCQPLYMFCKNFILKEQLNIEKMSTISDRGKAPNIIVKKLQRKRSFGIRIIKTKLKLFHYSMREMFTNKYSKNHYSLVVTTMSLY